MSETKRCPKCGEEKPPEVGFFHDRARADGYSSWCKMCMQAVAKARSIRLRAEAMDLIGGPVCKRCGFDDLRALTIDHIDGGGSQHRQDAGSLWSVLKHVMAHPDEYQVLCWNCNHIKRHENGEWSSHEFRAKVLAAPREKVTKPWRWARDYDACQGCGTTDRPPQGHGLCGNCYMEERRRAKGIKPKHRSRVVPPGELWSKSGKYTECADCGTTTVPHKQGGFCENCSMRRWNKAKADRIAAAE